MSTSPNRLPAPPAVTEPGKWMALAAAILGWLFDGFEIGMFPLTGPAALKELLPGVSDAVRGEWFGVIMAVFLIGAASGGVLFGWLGDRMGRVRAMSLSIATYAVFNGLCGFATEAWHIAVLRFLASLGMGGEWSLGVALVNEIWPGRSRAFIAGLIGSAANVGMLLVGLLGLVLSRVVGDVESFLPAVGFSDRSTDLLVRNEGWRLLMIAGALPAVLIFFIRVCVPESARWEQERARGATGFWSSKDLLGTLVGMIAACGVIVMWSPLSSGWLDGAAVAAVRGLVTIAGLAVALWGFLHPVRMYLRRSDAAGDVSTGERRLLFRYLLIGAALSGVALLGTWGSLQWAARWAGTLPDPEKFGEAKAYTQIAVSLGAVIATVLAALLADRLGRRPTYFLLCVGSIATLVAFYQVNSQFGWQFLTTAFLAGGVTAAFYGWFPLYLPELFPTAIRATSQGFAYNFGRVLAAIGTLQTAQVTAIFGGNFPKAGTVLSVIYLIGAVLIWFAPETKGKPLPE